MRKECPCRGCTDRKLYCHGSCRRYQDWKKDYEEAKPAPPEDLTNERSKRIGWRNLRLTRRRWRP